MTFNKEKLNNLADYNARLELIKLVDDKSISDDIEVNIPDKYINIWTMLKDMYVKGYMTCTKQIITVMTLENE